MTPHVSPVQYFRLMVFLVRNSGACDTLNERIVKKLKGRPQGRVSATLNRAVSVFSVRSAGALRPKEHLDGKHQDT